MRDLVHDIERMYEIVSKHHYAERYINEHAREMAQDVSMYFDSGDVAGFLRKAQEIKSEVLELNRGLRARTFRDGLHGLMDYSADIASGNLGANEIEALRGIESVMEDMLADGQKDLDKYMERLDYAVENAHYVLPYYGGEHTRRHFYEFFSKLEGRAEVIR